ncbi:hypothetical protein Sango_2649500 [Sesamum angolense]|uniref:Uncharacterized protein n=1 Tax=Sesamum angolense TaxID=2727404 RepID=A0AAE1W1W5_9LAMI|nr:hypothetical protein Sango_2649500 [Sesamum angolense]
MVENFEGVLKKEWYREDLKVLTSQIKEHESLLRLKRRWLMDLPLSISEQKRVEETLPPEDKISTEILAIRVPWCVERFALALRLPHPRSDRKCAAQWVSEYAQQNLMEEVIGAVDIYGGRILGFDASISGAATLYCSRNYSHSSLAIGALAGIYRTESPQLFGDIQVPGNVERCVSSLRLLGSVSARLCLGLNPSRSSLMVTGVNIMAQSSFAAGSIMRPSIVLLQC